MPRSVIVKIKPNIYIDVAKYCKLLIYRESMYVLVHKHGIRKFSWSNLQENQSFHVQHNVDPCYILKYDNLNSLVNLKLFYDVDVYDVMYKD